MEEDPEVVAGERLSKEGDAHGFAAFGKGFGAIGGDHVGGDLAVARLEIGDERETVHAV